ncbi:hypothetical protein VA7868_02943 [Vibrio aerogenes CECT 7868]|uniref:PepSY domain-containing protein n=1 Tax=Vibrio aerogenes CECT 7868 TaxID=1216006 RepID=A0A1M5ZMK1_9VIBR|nr:PepSY domain-containing protein [Vibrio aerogenes]SHI25404.1 hypothetical protein VA7868_02943 [Vibrio aerogenes CECT 7868]
MKLNKTTSLITRGFLLSFTLVSGAVFADPQCTTAPENNWIPFEKAKQQVLDMGYKIKVFKRTHTQCYELYGYDKTGERVEIYFNPVDMSKVKEE